jgi:hypothetical protein
VFLGGAFVGAAPEISYKLFLEALAARSVLIVAVPYATSFDHQRLADEIQYKLSSCFKELAPDVRGLPIYGLGTIQNCKVL